ncbi:hypothetical protein Y032_0636g940 [Ancylostoma ceylanicum]|uniref:SCP domain-containing protein n=1 Tax=Ancylostoma ceylanicum TaxID=53326 RepID=A0A016WJV2_9BILA|nr:hypothetical protein Y032_0636g940 [Ancylostoma ceylanicum]
MESPGAHPRTRAGHNPRQEGSPAITGLGVINLQYKPRGDSQGNLRESPIKGNAERHKAPDNKHNVVRGCGPSCNTAGLTPEVRQQILDFHSEKGKSLSWDCDLEQKAYDSIKTNEVDTRSIGHPANEYAEMPGPDGTMEKNVKDALNYWWDQNRNHERDNVCPFLKKKML